MADLEKEKKKLTKKFDYYIEIVVKKGTRIELSTLKNT